MAANSKAVLTVVHLGLLALVVVPFLLMGDRFDVLAMELLEGRHTFEVFTLTASLLAVDVFLPVPSSAVSVSAGMLMGMPLGFAACLGGLTAGCIIGYGFGYFFRQLNLNRWLEDGEFRRLSTQFSRYGYLLLILARGIPLLAELSVIVAGFHRYPLPRFLAVTFVANSALAALYTWLGQTADNLGSWYFVLALFIIIPTVTFGARLFWLRARNLHPESQ